MRTFKDQIAHEKKLLKASRIAFLKDVASLGLCNKQAAKVIGIDANHLRTMMAKHGMTADKRKTYTVHPNVKKQKAIILKQFRDRTAKKIAAGYKPDYARIEAAREMQMEAEG